MIGGRTRPEPQHDHPPRDRRAGVVRRDPQEHGGPRDRRTSTRASSGHVLRGGAAPNGLDLLEQLGRQRQRSNGRYVQIPTATRTASLAPAGRAASSRPTRAAATMTAIPAPASKTPPHAADPVDDRNADGPGHRGRRAGLEHEEAHAGVASRRHLPSPTEDRRRYVGDCCERREERVPEQRLRSADRLEDAVIESVEGDHHPDGRQYSEDGRGFVPSRAEDDGDEVGSDDCEPQHGRHDETGHDPYGPSARPDRSSPDREYARRPDRRPG